LTIQVNSQRHWAPFCRTLEQEAWADDPRFATMRARAENRLLLNGLVSERFVERSLAEWSHRLERERVPYAPVLDYVEALSDPQIQHRGQVLDLDHATSGKVRVVGPGWQMSGAQAEVSAPPTLGQHNENVLRNWLGLDDGEIGALAGVLRETVENG
jgi:crotonobetainyl-CoA:carnitine CoA-transferase CaiB-like acyl-CoA transferase